MQNDGRWKNVDYSAKGEKTTIGQAGCGPTCMAMVISSLTDTYVTPKDMAKWSLKFGYKAPHQGTYYSYFVPQGKFYEVTLKRLNTKNLYSTVYFFALSKPSIVISSRAFHQAKAGSKCFNSMGFVLEKCL